jgi:serine/threonine-protein kinase RsbW
MQADQRSAPDGRDASRAATREFSSEAMAELLRALRSRAVDHPESPALIASWPDVPADRMPAACAELRRRGHAVREVAISSPGRKSRRGWTMGDEAERGAAPDGLLIRELAVPSAVARARSAVVRLAEREGASESLRSALVLAVSEACSNVVMHAYADAPGHFEVRAGRVDDLLSVEVRDSGGGMRPRVDSPGLGLGLPLIARLADRFEIEHPDGQGVVMRMHFQLSQTQERIR